MINIADFKRFKEFSVTLSQEMNERLTAHLDKGQYQEDLTFAFWRPSQGKIRFTAVLSDLVLPSEGERILEGNVAFTSEYASRVLDTAKQGQGIALLHSHLGPGWQGMSRDDVRAEQERLAGAVAGRTGLPLLGMTRGTDESWSARFWLRQAERKYERYWARDVRVVGRRMTITFNPELAPPVKPRDSQIATVSVWGEQSQAIIARLRVGVIGLGSVGSIVAEALSRIGVSRITLIDLDRTETRNLDRTLGATVTDARRAKPKVKVSESLIRKTHTADNFEVSAYFGDLLTRKGMEMALDCDVLISCVDRPWPRHMMNALSYAHLIPVVDGGIIAKVDKGRLVHVDWRVHTVGPGRACLVCIGALRREEISLDREGLLDDPLYIRGLDPRFQHLLFRQNVLPFSLSVASHQVLQLVGLATGLRRIGGVGPQFYHGFPGRMDVYEDTGCVDGCEYAVLLASAADLTPNLRKGRAKQGTTD